MTKKVIIKVEKAIFPSKYDKCSTFSDVIMNKVTPHKNIIIKHGGLTIKYQNNGPKLRYYNPKSWTLEKVSICSFTKLPEKTIKPIIRDAFFRNIQLYTDILTELGESPNIECFDLLYFGTIDGEHRYTCMIVFHSRNEQEAKRVVFEGFHDKIT